MRKSIMMIAALLGVMQANAEDYSSFSFQKADGTVISMGIESLTMTVSDGKLIVTNANESQELSIADLSKMFFSTGATAISEINTDSFNGKIAVYGLDGTYRGSFDDKGQIAEQLGKGMYIIKDNNNTAKIAVR